jgi:hypothetical protein
MGNHGHITNRIIVYLLLMCHCKNRYLSTASDAKYLEATLGSYPGTNSTANGLVIIKFDPSASPSSSDENSYDITLFMDVYSVTPNCNTENSITNACGVHIHEGTETCTNATSIGGHYWNQLIYGLYADPWLPVKYTSDLYGRSEDIIHMYGGNGFHASENNYHTLILHDATGARIACGVLSAIQWSSSQNDSSITTTTTTTTVNMTTTTTTTIVSDDDDN